MNQQEDGASRVRTWTPAPRSSEALESRSSLGRASAEDVSRALVPSLATRSKNSQWRERLLALVQFMMEGKERMFLIFSFLALVGFILAAVEWDRS